MVWYKILAEYFNFFYLFHFRFLYIVLLLCWQISMFLYVQILG